MNATTITCTVNRPGTETPGAVYEIRDGRPRLIAPGCQYLDGIAAHFPAALKLAESHRSRGWTPDNVEVGGYRFRFSD